MAPRLTRLCPAGCVASMADPQSIPRPGGPVLAETTELDEGKRECQAGENGTDRCYGRPRHEVTVVGIFWAVGVSTDWGAARACLVDLGACLV
jgi:hypothetical protein